MAEAQKGVLTDALGRARRDEAESPAQKRLHPLIELTLARMREFLREKEAVFWVFVFPVLLACALGIAFRNTAPEEIPVAVANQEIAAALARQPGIKPLVLSEADAAQALRTGKVAIVVSEISNLKSEISNHTYRYDPTRPDSRMARLAVDDALQRALGRADVASAQDVTVTEPGARYIDFLIPGLIGLNLMGSGMWGLGFAVVIARTQKLLKRLAATPMRRSHYLLSFMLSRLTFLGFEVAAVLVFAWLAFGVAVHGSVFNVALIALTGAMAFAGLGLLVAARPKTIEGVSGLMNLVMMPMWLLSGTFFSSERFPDAVQPFIKALPLTALNDALRAIISDGNGLAAVWSQLAVMLAWGLVSFAIALRIFRWQ
ncbi:MAG TPA: ABC transporter permease [Blastocatellia bacterium]|nr:ABC transporter permease [Blastocatellia bacterium]